MASKPETILQRKIVKALRTIGVWVIVMNVTKRRSARGVNCGEPGMPDLCLPALGWLEVKLPSKKLPDDDLDHDQVAWHERAVKAGVRVATVAGIGDAYAYVRKWQKDKATGRGVGPP